MADESYDVLVIGTSQGGRFLPLDLAQAGKRVALIERGPLGRACVNTGCTPTKTMVASARLAHLARRAGEYGWRPGRCPLTLLPYGNASVPWWPAHATTMRAASPRTASTSSKARRASPGPRRSRSS
ncbi:FAD-dependent oxidoreductase [Streptomyces sp. NPDC048508]|uniref:FAD-dependent oxidoreductase n=1 Tax=Streptomyces sp. NPDC048508 TaxID=3365561 RepID=UPI00371F1A0E